MAQTEEWKVNIEKLNKQKGYDYKQKDKGFISETPIENLDFPDSPYKSILQLHEHFNDKNDPTKLSIMHINMRSICRENKFGSFIRNLCLMERMPDIICVSETWFVSYDDLEKYTIPNYFLEASS